MGGQKDLFINHVKKIYEINSAEIEVLEDINLNVKSGEFISIVGASGCGKSTLMKIIAGIEKATSGTVYVGDQIVERPSVNTGMIFQEARLFPWMTVEENIKFGIHRKMRKSEAKDQVKKYIDIVGLAGFEKAIPNQLSGGMQQRVSIARALINNPAVLIMDEPFGALDALTRIKMQKAVLEIWEKEKTTIILITHDIDEAVFLSDRILVMDKNPGRITRELAIRTARPRGRNSSDFIEARKTIYEEFFQDVDIELEYYI